MSGKMKVTRAVHFLQSEHEKWVVKIFMKISRWINVEIQNEKKECVKETTTRPKSRKQQKAITISSTQQENPASAWRLQLALKHNCTSAEKMDTTLHLLT